jgi:hypothetical protein
MIVGEQYVLLHQKAARYAKQNNVGEFFHSISTNLIPEISCVLDY